MATTQKIKAASSGFFCAWCKPDWVRSVIANIICSPFCRCSEPILNDSGSACFGADPLVIHWREDLTAAQHWVRELSMRLFDIRCALINCRLHCLFHTLLFNFDSVCLRALWEVQHVRGCLFSLLVINVAYLWRIICLRNRSSTWYRSCNSYRQSTRILDWVLVLDG